MLYVTSSTNMWQSAPPAPTAGLNSCFEQLVEFFYIVPLRLWMDDSPVVSSRCPVTRHNMCDQEAKLPGHHICRASSQEVEVGFECVQCSC